ncbi:AAA family ATPase [Streptomyces salyersiae]|uniref:AAA family ATPase n=1 Tax=Streptomyces salyersiae TaxID=3075530 RepID=A0ABU2RMX6_9ACTN|nr:AAA family ATPase [Streptomyces sp. DSM 41770]MDT0428863.1 AAA family ATPase [Streptomyces sp. DSM 41770]
MTLQPHVTAAGAAGAPGDAREAMPAQPGAPVRERLGPQGPVRDLRGRGGRGPRALDFAPGDVVVVSGLPGSGKSTLIRRTVPGHAVDSQDTRDRWARSLPRLFPYPLYRPLVRLAHYRGLWRALRGGGSVVVHDCGTQAWVRRWLARDARRRGRALHLILLDVTPDVARQGQRERGRGVSGYAFARHRRAVGRLLRGTESGQLPPGCVSAVLLDREAADAIVKIAFTGAAGAVGTTGPAGATGTTGVTGS